MNRSKGRNKIGMGLAPFSEAVVASPKKKSGTPGNLYSGKQYTSASPQAHSTLKPNNDFESTYLTSSTRKLAEELREDESSSSGVAAATPETYSSEAAANSTPLSMRRPSLTAPAAANNLAASVLTFLDTMDPCTPIEPAIDAPVIVRRLSRRPSLTVPAAASDLQDSVMMFLDTMNPYSPEETPSPLAISEALLPPTSSSPTVEKRRKSILNRRKSETDDDISVLTINSAFNNTAAASLFPMVSPSSRKEEVHLSPASTGKESRLSDIFDNSTAPINSENVHTHYDSTLTSESTQEHDITEIYKKTTRSRPSKEDLASTSFDETTEEDNDDGSVYTLDSMYPDGPRRKSVPRRVIKPVNPVSNKLGVTSNPRTLRSVIRQAALQAQKSPDKASPGNRKSIQKKMG